MSNPAWVWSLSFFSLFLSMRGFSWKSLPLGELFRAEGEDARLRKVSETLCRLEESLEAGLSPAEEDWSRLQSLPAPWGSLAHGSLQALRSSGGALLPTLRRLRSLAQSHRAAWAEGRARCAQALSQAGICALMVPGFGAALYGLLPGVSEHPVIWAFTMAGALMLSAFGAIWLYGLAESARWGGLPSERRAWVLAAQCSVERFLALVRAGTPPDLSWAGACEILSCEAPELALEWGYSIFEPARKSALDFEARTAAGALVRSGLSIRKAIQTSLMEGHPCVERVESILKLFQEEWKACVERELSLLGTRGLKPLFLCVAPALFGLLAMGVFLAWETI